MPRFRAAKNNVRIYGVWRNEGEEFDLDVDDAVIAQMIESGTIESVDGFVPVAFAQAEVDDDDDDLDDEDDEDLDDIPEEAKPVAPVKRPEPPPVTAAKVTKKKARR